MKMMKTVILVLIVTLFMFGCASSPKKSDYPDFFINPPVAEDGIYGVGAAKLNNASMAQQAAIGRARTSIAFSLESSVKAAMTDYYQEAGVDGDTQAIAFLEQISRQVTEITLSGTVVEKMDIAADGTWYALVFYPARSAVDDVSATFQRNEDAAFANFKADQALDALNSELENNPPATQTTEK